MAILDNFGASEYVTPPGSLGYLHDDAFAQRARQQLLVHDFQPEPYAQRGGSSFVSHRSSLDVVAHLGWQAAWGYRQQPVPCVRTLELQA